MTRLDYLENTYLFQSSAKLIEILDTERGVALVLDCTVFHPQGGGQPADTGIVKSETGEFVVTDTRLNENGIIYHFGEFTHGSINNGDTVRLEIDQNARILHARLHSAGHLIDIAVRKAGLTNLIPTKGYHFTNGANVEYQGSLENAGDWAETIEKLSNQLVNDSIDIHAKQLNADQAASMSFSSPQGKTSRFVWLENNESDGCGCGGTHLNNSKEIGQIIIRKIKTKKGVTKISYTLDLNHSE
jgi:Ser-tRNA(Ala) deacylase AlaX